MTQFFIIPLAVPDGSKISKDWKMVESRKVGKKKKILKRWKKSSDEKTVKNMDVLGAHRFHVR